MWPANAISIADIDSSTKECPANCPRISTAADLNLASASLAGGSLAANRPTTHVNVSPSQRPSCARRQHRGGRRIIESGVVLARRRHRPDNEDNDHN